MSHNLAYMFSKKGWFVFIILSVLLYVEGWGRHSALHLNSFRTLSMWVGAQSWIPHRKQIMSFAFIDRALDILEEINLSVRRKNKFSEAAYDKLLNNNLSLKYSQIGCLSSSNIISDGFYDYGRVSDSTYLCFSMYGIIIFPLIMMPLYGHFISTKYNLHFYRWKFENQHIILNFGYKISHLYTVLTRIYLFVV